MAFSVAPMVFLTFSEPLDKASGETTANYGWRAPGAAIESASLSDDGKTVALKLASSASTDVSELVVHGVKDRSESGNPMPETPVMIAVLQPTYRQPDDATAPTDASDVTNLPAHAGDAWTINLMLKTDKQPPNRTPIAGFGALVDETGQGRHLAKFANGIHFWSSHRDVESTEPLDVKKWQMLTATYDGTTLRLYKNGKPIGENAIGLSDDESAVHIRPIDPWDKKRRLDGQVRDMTIWNSALPGEAIQSLWKAEQK
jgi:alpha-mannosidase